MDDHNAMLGQVLGGEAVDAGSLREVVEQHLGSAPQREAAPS